MTVECMEYVLFRYRSVNQLVKHSKKLSNEMVLCILRVQLSNIIVTINSSCCGWHLMVIQNYQTATVKRFIWCSFRLQSSSIPLSLPFPWYQGVLDLLIYHYPTIHLAKRHSWDCCASMQRNSGLQRPAWKCRRTLPPSRNLRVDLNSKNILNRTNDNATRAVTSNTGNTHDNRRNQIHYNYN